MSIKVMTWVWEHSPVGGSERLVLLAIADSASDDGANAWPSIATLARKCRVDERTVQRIIRRLADAGHLIIDENKGGRRSNRYTVVMTVDRSEAPVPPANCHPRQTATGGTQPPHPRRSATAAATQLCHPNVLDPSLNRPSFAPSRARRPDSSSPVDENPPTPEPVDTDVEVQNRAFGIARDWVARRAGQGSPIVVRGKASPVHALASLTKPALVAGYSDAEIVAALERLDEGFPSAHQLDRALHEVRAQRAGRPVSRNGRPAPSTHVNAQWVGVTGGVVKPGEEW